MSKSRITNTCSSTFLKYSVLRYLIALSLYAFGLFANSEEFAFIDPVQIDNLSPEISRVLTKEGCKIPQWKYGFGGVAVGEFVQKGQTDIAVICIRDGISTIKVFWGGPKSCPSNIKSIGQFINTVNEKYITDRYHDYGGTEPPPITHDGLNDHFVEKASIVRYCHNGVWIELTGAD